MSRINTNVQSLIAQRVLGQNNNALNTSLERLSTGVRINRGADDPAGLIASENLRGQKAALGAAIGNAERADQVANIAEGGLQEISSLLTELQGLITTSANTAGLSKEERSANQLQIDSILQTIDRISDSTSFQGNKLLNGNFDFTTTNVDDQISDFRVLGAKLGYNQNLDVEVLVTTSAQRAGLFMETGATLDLGGSGQNFTIEIAGSLGARELSFASGTTVADMVAAINTFTDVTGVSAVASGTGLVIRSEEYGSDEFVNVKVVNAAGITGTGVGIFQLEADDFNTAQGTGTAFNAATNGVRDTGQNVQATVNGIAATSNGRQIRINTDFLNVELNLGVGGTDPNAETLGQISAFRITGGGADFQLAANVDIAGKVSLGISDVSTRKLGTSALGFLSDLGSGKTLNVVDGNLTDAQKTVGEAIRQITSIRGRIGAFQKNTVGATIRNLGVTLENTTAAESAIRDTDFASETAALTRAQILAQASTNSLALANQQPQAALSLLG